MNRLNYKIKTVFIICLLGILLSFFGCQLKENESIFDYLEKKQVGLGFVSPIIFFGFLRYRKKESSKILD